MIQSSSCQRKQAEPCTRWYHWLIYWKVAKKATKAMMEFISCKAINFYVKYFQWAFVTQLVFHHTIRNLFYKCETKREETLLWYSARILELFEESRSISKFECSRSDAITRDGKWFNTFCLPTILSHLSDASDLSAKRQVKCDSTTNPIWNKDKALKFHKS